MRLRTITFRAAGSRRLLHRRDAADERAVAGQAAVSQANRPALQAMPPLQPLTGTSVVLAPAAIALSARSAKRSRRKRRTISAASRKIRCRNCCPARKLTFTVNRGPLAVSGQPGVLLVTTPLSGQFEALGTLTGAVGSGVSAVGNAVGNRHRRRRRPAGAKPRRQGVRSAHRHPRRGDHGGAADHRAELAHRAQSAGQVNIVDVVLPIGGLKLSVASAVKPVLDGALRDQMTALETRLRNDPFIENAARAEWAKLCQSISLGAAGQGMPNLWLEIRPVRAIAAQPQIDGRAVTLLVGMQAQTRIVPNQTKPDCPFPQQLDLVAQANGGGVNIAVPIDIPFTEVSRLLDTQFVGKTFPEDGSGAFAATVKAGERRGGGRPAPDLASRPRQEAGLLRDRRRRHARYLGQARARPEPPDPALHRRRARRAVAGGIRAARRGGAGGGALPAKSAGRPGGDRSQAVRRRAPGSRSRRRSAGSRRRRRDFSAKVAVTDLRLTGVAYDNTTLRIIANATGSVNVAISSLSMQ